MHFLDIFLIGVALSMDAFAVSISNTLIYKHYSSLAMALAFGLFQGLMPLTGYFTGSFFAAFINRYAGLISLIILGFIGGKMIFDSFRKDEKDNCKKDRLTYKILLLQAIATSIDAFAVGVSFVGVSFMGSLLNIFTASSLIALTTFALSLAAIFVGKRAGNLFGSKPELVGGIILVIIGLKAFLF